MTKGALYARVSTDGQQNEGTIESQLAELRKQVAAVISRLVKSLNRRSRPLAARPRPAILPDGVEDAMAGINRGLGGAISRPRLTTP
jgi:hypothetical protein